MSEEFNDEDQAQLDVQNSGAGGGAAEVGDTAQNDEVEYVGSYWDAGASAGEAGVIPAFATEDDAMKEGEDNLFRNHIQFVLEMAGSTYQKRWNTGALLSRSGANSKEGLAALVAAAADLKTNPRLCQHLLARNDGGVLPATAKDVAELKAAAQDVSLQFDEEVANGAAIKPAVSYRDITKTELIMKSLSWIRNKGAGSDESKWIGTGTEREEYWRKVVNAPERSLHNLVGNNLPVYKLRPRSLERTGAGWTHRMREAAVVHSSHGEKSYALCHSSMVAQALYLMLTQGYDSVSEALGGSLVNPGEETAEQVQLLLGSLRGCNQMVAADDVEACDARVAGQIHTFFREIADKAMRTTFTDLSATASFSEYVKRWLLPFFDYSSDTAHPLRTQDLRQRANALSKHPVGKDVDPGGG